jgi:long-chain acyl-CoA synthetase
LTRFLNRKRSEQLMKYPFDHKPWLKSYDEGVPHTVEVPDHPLQHFLDESARKYPNHTAMIFKGRSITYQETKEMADAIAAGLVANGFKKGDRAVVYMPNTPQFVATYYGILKAGGIVVATNPLYTERELEHQLADCGAETVFVMSLFYNRLKAVQKTGHTNVKRVIVTNIKEYLPTHLRILFGLLKEKKEGHRVTIENGDMAFQDFLAMGKKSPPAKVEVSGDDIALLQYTGGTTGLSKGAIGLHRNMAANTMMLRAWLTDWQEAKEIILTGIPLFHSYGMVTAMHFSMSMSGTMVLIPNPRDQKDVLGSINKYKPTLFPGVPAMYVAINNNPDVAAGKYDIRSIRVCLSGSRRCCWKPRNGLRS